MTNPAPSSEIDRLREALRAAEERNGALWEELQRARPAQGAEQFASPRGYIERVGAERQDLRDQVEAGGILQFATER